MDDAQFHAVAKQALARIRVALDQEDPDVIELVTEADVVKIQFPAGAPFVLNTQGALHELWLAADRQAWHFKTDDAGQFVCKKSGVELWSTLSSLLLQKTGRTIAF